jgi:peptidyl-prolyl cis-trans isomerase D
MALIGTLRNKMGIGVIIFVFVAIAAFILGDLFGNQGNGGGMFNQNTVGEIAGHTVSHEEYQQMVREQEASYYMNYNREATERDKPLLEQQAWELLILKYAIQKQFEKTGVEAPADEVWDMIQGKNIDPNVKQAFTNPETQQFEKDRVVSYINQLKSMPQGSEPRVRWEMFQKNLKPGRERIKYENLIIKTNYITTAEAEREYHNTTDVAEVKYLYIPYYAISDSSVTITDDQFQDYYKRNKEKFKTEHTRDLIYISIPVVASAEDSLDIKTEFANVTAEFKTTEEDSTFAAINTDGKTPYTKYTPATLPAFVTVDSLKLGKVIGPFLDGNGYKTVKISKIGTDTVYSAKANHILIKWADPSEASKKEAKEKARNILKEIKGGASFAEKAREHGTDGTASRGGDLGWFSSGQMVKPFENAVFDAGKKGLLNDVVETDFGYHIIEVTQPKTNIVYHLAVVEREITPSEATTNSAYGKAEAFVTDLSGVDEFKARATKEGYTVQEAKNILAGDRRIGSLGEARQIARWLFNDAEIGKVSEVVDLKDQYVVSVMTDEVKKGYKPLEKIKEEITPAVRNEVKGKQIIEKLNSAKGTLEEMAKSFGSDANVYSSSDLKLNSTSLPTVGFDPVAVGLAFSLENGKRSAPIASENGVVIIEATNKTIAPEIADYSTHKTQLEQGANSRSSFNIGNALKEGSDIEDERYKFY